DIGRVEDEVRSVGPEQLDRQIPVARIGRSSQSLTLDWTERKMMDVAGEQGQLGEAASVEGCQRPFARVTHCRTSPRTVPPCVAVSHTTCVARCAKESTDNPSV